MKKTAKSSAQAKRSAAIFPPAIQKGDTIGLVAPAGSLLSKDSFTAGVRILEEKGFRVKFNRQLLHAKGYLAGSDKERADEFNRLWSDPEVKALVAARGGYGCLRMLDLIDMKQIRQNPKIFIGFSDLTGLLAAINKKTRLVTYHGPVVTTLASIDKQSTSSFFKVLTDMPQSPITLKKLRVIHGGKAEGILVGGNLTTLVHLIGTPYEIPWPKAILFIEDVDEKPYSLDRLITHLAKSNRLQKIKGLILGTFTDEDKKERVKLLKTVEERIGELLQDMDIPVWTNFPVGHSRRNLTLPIGLDTEMNSKTKTLQFSCR